jgi:hypothetical protein
MSTALLDSVDNDSRVFDAKVQEFRPDQSNVKHGSHDIDISRESAHKIEAKNRSPLSVVGILTQKHKNPGIAAIELQKQVVCM